MEEIDLTYEGIATAKFPFLWLPDLFEEEIDLTYEGIATSFVLLMRTCGTCGTCGTYLTFQLIFIQPVNLSVYYIILLIGNILIFHTGKQLFIPVR